jgi:hypothetical protein
MQLTLNFEAGVVSSYSSCREYIASRIHQQGRSQKSIAADMDYSPSDLSRKLAQAPDDSRRFTLDDLESYVRATGDTKPILYLAEKYLAGACTAELERQIAELQSQLHAKKGRAARHG